MMMRTSHGTGAGGRFSLRPLRAALAVTACAVAGLAGLAVLPAAASPAAPAAVSPNQAPRSAAALAFGPGGTGYAFYRGADNAVYLRTFTGSAPAWSAQAGIGGVIVGAPAAAFSGTTLVLAARGTDNALWVRMLQNGAWGRWASWGGTLTSSPAVSGMPSGRADVFARGADNAIWTRTLAAGGLLTGWRSIGGRVVTAPAVASTLTEVYAVGTDHAVWVNVGSGWRSLGGRTDSTPAVGYIPESNGAFVYVRGTDNALWGETIGGGNISGWRKIGGSLADAPAAAGTRVPDPHTIVGVIGADKALWTTPGGWSNAFTRAWLPVG